MGWYTEVILIAEKLESKKQASELGKQISEGVSILNLIVVFVIYSVLEIFHKSQFF